MQALHLLCCYRRCCEIPCPDVSPLVWACHVHNLKDCRRLREPLHVFKTHQHTEPQIPTPLLQATSRGHKTYSRCSNLFCETIADSLQCTPPVERSHHVRPHEIMTLSESISSNHRRISSIHTRDSRKAEMPGSLCQPIPQILGRMCPRYSLKTCPSVYFSFVGCDAVKDAD